MHMNADIFRNHHFELSSEELTIFEKFLTLFIEYNAHTNLSAIRDEEGIVEKHFVDSLYAAEVIMDYRWGIIHTETDSSLHSEWQNKIKLLDIGSGWGFPGIPLKIVMPELHVTLLDSVGKKVKAMNYFIEELGLIGISAIQERAEILAKNPAYAHQYDIVVSRATAYMSEILSWSVPFLAPHGTVILYKMPSEVEKNEIGKITKKLHLQLEWELEYSLAGKARILYIFSKK